MARIIRKTALAALCITAACAGLVACDDDDEGFLEGLDDNPSLSKPALDGLSGTKKISIRGSSVNVACSGSRTDGKPVVVVLAGLDDDLTKTAAFRKTLGTEHRVCSYDRLGQGGSDKPSGVQSLAAGGKILTGVLDQVAGDTPVVLVGHSLGGLVAARYAPDHQDRVKGLVLLDATSPTTSGDIQKVIPASATGPSAQLREQAVAVARGQNSEKLAFPDAAVRPAGDIPVEVVQHGTKYLGAFPVYGAGLERVWTEGQHKWAGISGNSKLSTAADSAHHIYVDRADLAVKAVRRVTAQVTR
ncbi:alpha/beta fold hydrolase [Streptomyces sp. NPDC050423]|uniref:alpha/beta fold hydrolase n=1 Tax=Streptomyces sp. NPDC050423 TaxID=3155402 RepID=UPI0034331AB1